MTRGSSQLRLTAELVARFMASVPPVVPAPMDAGRRPAIDADWEAVMAAILAGAPSSGEVWVFGYGSLIWKPAFAAAEERAGVAHGWRRSFCLGWDRWFRGCPERPGLMLALDRGGQCHGVVWRVPQEAREESLLALLRREVVLVPHPFPPRWITVRTAAGPVLAVTFAMDRRSDAYVPGLSVEKTADILAAAVGPYGSMAEYLHSTVAHLEALGLHDRHLWRLQDMVAARIEAALAADEGAVVSAPVQAM